MCAATFCRLRPILGCLCAAACRPGAAGREGAVGQRLLLRWAEEQWAGSLQRMQAAEGALDKLKTAAKAAALKMKDTRFTLEVLHLCSS